MATVLALLAGCQTTAHNVVYLTPQSPDKPGPTRRWVAQNAVFTSDARGQYQLLAEAPPSGGDPAVQQWLYVRVIWSITPSQSGTDPTAMNALVGYLVRTTAAPKTMPDEAGSRSGSRSGSPSTQADGATLYYEGIGNVFIDRPGWLGGKTRFTIRHALLRLAQSNRDRSVDPFVLVEASGEILTGVDPQAEQRISQILGIINQLGAPGQPPAQPTTMPNSN